jgi:two-component system, LuxR family, sensor kinase FixL
MNRSHPQAVTSVLRSIARSWEIRGAVVAIAYLVIYLAIDGLVAVRPVFTVGVTPWSPETALSLAILMLAGNRWLPVVLAAFFMSANLIHAPHTAPLMQLAASLWLTLVYGGLAAILRRWHGPRPILTTADAARFAAVSSVAAAIAATGYIGLFVFVGEIAPADALYGIARYGFADLNGILVLTPLLVQAAKWHWTFEGMNQHMKAMLAQLVCVLVTLVVLFALPAANQLRFFYLLFLPVIGIALRWSSSGALFAVLLIEIGIVAAARAGILTLRFMDLQVPMLVLTLTALLLGAVVTDRRRAEEQLRERDASLARAMRFAVAGELASALAHELNQPITALVSYLRAAEILAARGTSEVSRLKATLVKAVQESLRASEVLHRLREFYRGDVRKRESVDLRVLCSTVAKAFQDRLRDARAYLAVSVDPSVPDLAGDGTQLEIVLHNLLANAIDAVTNTEGRFERIELNVSYADNAVFLRVEDSGQGVAMEVEPRLFEPFVTRKSGGMGLGLALSRSLVRAQGGELSHAPGGRLGGACFTIRLPLEVPTDAPA